MKPSHTLVKLVKLSELRPTQASVGRHAVERKRKKWKKMSKAECQAEMDKHWLPSVLGPGKAHYIVDHHHEAVAMLELGIKTAQVIARKDWSHLDEQMFWRMLDFERLAWLYDAHGRRITYDQMPKRLRDLQDDPYRSLAGLAQKAGAFAKELPPFGEFVWADHFRQRIDPSDLDPLDGALVKALELARETEAQYLPGWAGDSHED